MQDQYILHTAESQNISLPFACRHGIVLLVQNVLCLFFTLSYTSVSYAFQIFYTLLYISFYSKLKCALSNVSSSS